MTYSYDKTNEMH